MIHKIREIMRKNKIMFLIAMCILTCIVTNIVLLYQYLETIKNLY